jgi:hypothetical protein
MADIPGTHIVEIRAGTSQRPVIELRPGEVLQPMSVGRVGMWVIDAPDVLDVHAYMYFDGRALFVQSADPQNPAKGNGKPIAMTWQQIEIPCTIEVGRARLVYRTLDDMEDDGDDKTVAQPIQIPKERLSAPAAFGQGAFSNRKGPDSDATRLAPMPNAREPDPTVVSPLEMMGTPAAGVPKARPAAGMPAWSANDGSPNSSPTTIGAPPAPPPPQNTGYQQFGSVQVAVPAVPPAPNAMGQTLQAPMQSPLANMGPPMMQQQGMPPMMQQQQQGMPPMMQQGMPPGMQGYPPQGMPPNMMPANASGPYMQQGMPGQPNAETGRLPHVQIPPELKGFAKAKAEWNAMPPIRKVIFGCFPGVLLLVYFMAFDDDPVPQHRTKPVSTDSIAMADAAPAVDAGLAVAPMLDAAVAIATSATNLAPPPTSTAPLPKGKRTPERDAIDLVTQGQYARAADIYEQLGTQHPEQPAYKEAARLLRLRANGM